MNESSQGACPKRRYCLPRRSGTRTKEAVERGKTAVSRVAFRKERPFQRRSSSGAWSIAGFSCHGTRSAMCCVEACRLCGLRPAPVQWPSILLPVPRHRPRLDPQCRSGRAKGRRRSASHGRRDAPPPAPAEGSERRPPGPSLPARSEPAAIGQAAGIPK